MEQDGDVSMEEGGRGHVWYVRIDNWHPTPLNRLMRVHWAKRARMKKHDASIIAVSVLGADVEPATSRRRVSLEIILAPKQRGADPDAYWKVVNDALVHCGALVNDSHEWLELGEVSYSRGTRRATVIRVENLNPPKKIESTPEQRNRKRPHRLCGIRLRDK